MIRMPMRWETVTLKTYVRDGLVDIAVLYRDATIGWEIPMKGDYITVEGNRWLVTGREYIPGDREWIITVSIA